MQKGDVSAFEHLYDLYRDKLYGFSLKLLASEELSKDVVQETFIKLWENRQKIDETKSLSSYLFTISKNLIKDHQNSYSKAYELSSSLPSNDSSFSVEVLDDLNFNEIKKMEAKVVNDLTPQQKEVYILSRHKHLSHQEIADNMGISVNSVKTHLRLALKTLRVHISPITDFLLIIITILITH
ncbi:RNA polymerase sigma-70 factor [Flammeovirgaceae bacterium SG7u.132]|nr:RNA polymerase sigma-70 factor [Flammeovirgaceae bacterium SG7u.132]